VEAETMEDAIRIASEMALADDVVLFSPACKSFDMFANYEERGRAFKRLVAAL
jgi:UDP-N-acetylmuramoylalanine--D-glutamate ligase